MKAAKKTEKAEPVIVTLVQRADPKPEPVDEIERAVHETFGYPNMRQSFIAGLNEADKDKFFRIAFAKLDDDIAFFTAESRKTSLEAGMGPCPEPGAIGERQQRCRERIEELHKKRAELEAECNIAKLPYDWTDKWYRLVAIIEELARRGVIPKKNGKDDRAIELFLKDGKSISKKMIQKVRADMAKDTGDKEYVTRDFVLSAREIEIADAIEKAERATGSH